jgi:hypothetical protein
MATWPWHGHLILPLLLLLLHLLLLLLLFLHQLVVVALVLDLLTRLPFFWVAHSAASLSLLVRLTFESYKILTRIIRFKFGSNA